MGLGNFPSDDESESGFDEEARFEENLLLAINEKFDRIDAKFIIQSSISHQKETIKLLEIQFINKLKNEINFDNYKFIGEKLKHVEIILSEILDIFTEENNALIKKYIEKQIFRHSLALKESYKIKIEDKFKYNQDVSLQTIRSSLDGLEKSDGTVTKDIVCDKVLRDLIVFFDAENDYINGRISKAFSIGESDGMAKAIDETLKKGKEKFRNEFPELKQNQNNTKKDPYKTNIASALKDKLEKMAKHTQYDDSDEEWDEIQEIVKETNALIVKSKEISPDEKKEALSVFDVKTWKWEQAEKFFLNNKEEIQFIVIDPDKNLDFFFKLNDTIYLEGELVSKDIDEQVKIIRDKKGEKFSLKISEGENTREINFLTELGRVEDFLFQKKGDDIRSYVVTKCLPEKTLFEKLVSAKNAMSLLEKYKLAFKCIEAIECFHDKKFIHENIKPESFVISDENEVFLVNFEMTLKLIAGLERLHTAQGRRQKYSPPEVRELMAHGDFEGDYDTEVWHSCAFDIYSFGIMLQEDFKLKVPSELLHHNPRQRPRAEEVKDWLKRVIIALESAKPVPEFREEIRDNPYGRYKK